MPDFIERVNWQEYVTMLERGEPSVAVQLAIINAGLLIYWVLRRARRAGKMQPRNAWLLPVMFAAGNGLVISFGDRLAIHI